MSNITVTQNSLNIDTGLDDAIYEDETFTAAGAATFLQGTILARDSVSLKLVLFVKGGSTNENGIPKAVLNRELVTTGAGDVPLRPLIAGSALLGRLVIDADGDNSNIDAAVRDELRDYNINVLDSTERKAGEL